MIDSTNDRTSRSGNCRLTWTIDGNEMVDDNWIWRMKKRMKSLGNIGELHLEAVEDLRQISIAINEFSLVGILEERLTVNECIYSVLHFPRVVSLS